MTPEEKLAATARLVYALRALVGPDGEGDDEWELLRLDTSDDEEEGYHVQMTLELVVPSESGGII